jgi:hypothetical protein
MRCEFRKRGIERERERERLNWTENDLCVVKEDAGQVSGEPEVNVRRLLKKNTKEGPRKCVDRMRYKNRGSKS